VFPFSPEIFRARCKKVEGLTILAAPVGSDHRSRSVTDSRRRFAGIHAIVLIVRLQSQSVAACGTLVRAVSESGPAKISGNASRPAENPSPSAHTAASNKVDCKVFSSSNTAAHRTGEEF
jgi:hypothetical protein